MKKILNGLIALLCIFVATSCEKNNYTVSDYIPASADFAAVINAQKVAEEGGLTVAKNGTLECKPEFVSNLSESEANDIKGINNILSNSGVDLSSMGIYVPNYGDIPVYILKLSDKGKFEKGINTLGFSLNRGQLGIKSYTKGDEPKIAIATRGNIALLINIEGTDIDAIWHYFIIADEDPMSRQTADEVFIKGNLSMVKEMPDDVSQFISAVAAGQPDMHDCLAFAKYMISMFADQIR